MAPKMDRDFLQQAAQAVADKLPDNWGFVLLAAPFGEHTDPTRAVYVSTVKREDAIALMKEWLLKCSGPEEWLKHLK